MGILNTKNKIALASLCYKGIHAIRAFAGKSDEIFIAVTSPDGAQQYWPTNQQPRPGLNAGFNSIIEVSNQPGIYTITVVGVYQGRFIHCKTIKRMVQKE